MSPAVSHRSPGLRRLCYTRCYIREDLIRNDLHAYVLKFWSDVRGHLLAQIPRA
jgi:hypothetical protein